MTDTMPIFVSIQEVREAQHAVVRVASRHPAMEERARQVDALLTLLRQDLVALYERTTRERAERIRHANALRGIFSERR